MMDKLPDAFSTRAEFENVHLVSKSALYDAYINCWLVKFGCLKAYAYGSMYNMCTYYGKTWLLRAYAYGCINGIYV